MVNLRAHVAVSSFLRCGEGWPTGGVALAQLDGAVLLPVTDDHMARLVDRTIGGHAKTTTVVVTLVLEPSILEEGGKVHIGLVGRVVFQAVSYTHLTLPTKRIV